ncbi:hypothetical protein IFM89_013559 [Coptis chinensis]|uniref:TIR domain-containing protein n=1 Tax=Coptis chinensis TaxID=261450 RepID=A0A835I257_9MAGN|nr:hypothetical protein IFM89_013559 [Coptis chinensis]
MYPSLLKNMGKQILRYRNHTQMNISRPCDVFINHRGIDTKRTVAGLLHDSLALHNIRPFLDSESLKPGDKLFDKIHSGITECDVAVAVFSPHYCESYFCLLELALIMECKKKVIPIFCDIKPSELHIVDDGFCSENEVRRFRRALEEARYTVGITFDSRTGNWPELIRRTTDNVFNSLAELECGLVALSLREFVFRECWFDQITVMAGGNNTHQGNANGNENVVQVDMAVMMTQLLQAVQNNHGNHNDPFAKHNKEIVALL